MLYNIELVSAEEKISHVFSSFVLTASLPGGYYESLLTVEETELSEEVWGWVPGYMGWYRWGLDLNFLLSRVAEASNGRENHNRPILVGGGKWKGKQVQSPERPQRGSEAGSQRAGAPQGPGREA